MTIKNKLLIAAGLAGSVALGHQAASANDTQQHTIKSGETLSAIANMYNTSVDEIAKANNISNVDQIYTGENLIIGQANTSSASTDSTSVQTTNAANADGSYTVQSGDNLWTLASRFNTTVSNLASWNNIQNVDQLTVGQVLKTSADDQSTQTAATTTDTQSQTDTQSEAQATSASTTAQVTDTAATTQDTSAATVVSTSATVSNQSTTADSTDEQSALQAIIMLESGGNVNATNGIYYGIGQLSPSLRARYGGNTADYQDQLQAMKSYIADRYGSAVAALAHHRQYNWY
ncbi:LysM peptidoglycan-binding domain-containing protein [Fructobacillus fructosus]|uniref:LysM repeat (LysM) n=1 Tax=Fructobacillus fructosus TaxID=1631 RepID=A0ABM9MPN3_9LACO|nr:LysM domain-containing protein [Fructobacillus fructosus]MBC9118736.1 LysM peptidoglycan-binding domain-containing protein [Fructobacillus fructosus]MBD9365400.1 LysM peptidoglycan-binding domain-containing protein [Leuconostoc mesenteroides]CAK1231252.1 LysM repeat (LysM) [Fructobacillus fructosus]